MNAAFTHILINHIPILGLTLSLILILVSLFIWKSADIQRLALGFFVLTALVTIPTLLSGEAAEDLVPQTHELHEAVEAHEHAAKPTFWVVELTGLLALVALALSKKSGQIPNMLMMLLLVSALAATAMAANTSHLGGLIAHPEIQR